MDPRAPHAHVALLLADGLEDAPNDVGLHDSVKLLRGHAFQGTEVDDRGVKA